jgi:serine/threonine-protein kinase
MVRTQTELRPGDVLLGFRVVRVIGRGGMGVVYLAEQLVLDRLVALKLLAPELAADEMFRERFLRESRLAASLDHPNIVPVFDAGEVEGRLYIAMRYVEGCDLGRLLAREGPLEPARAIALLAPVADALDAAHARGLVHRDVKPSNVLLDQAERPYLADFGLTKESSERGLVEQSHFAASVEYVAPEQIEGRPVDGRADQYALACVLYQCLTGRTPFANGSTMATLWGHVDGEPPKASERNEELPGEVDAVLERALAKNPDQRYGTCTELVVAAGDALGLAQPLKLRRWLQLVVVVAIALAGALAAVLVTTAGGEERPPPVVTDDTLVRIDPKTEEVTAAIKVGSGVKAVAVGGRTVWVYNVTQGTITAIDAATNQVERVSRISSTPRDASYWNGPLIAADEAGAWVVGNRGVDGVLTRVRGDASSQVEYEIFSGSPRAGDGPVAVSIAGNGVWILVRNGCISARCDHRYDADLIRIDPSSGRARQRIRFPASYSDGPHGVAVGDGALWVTDSEAGALYRVDPTSSEVTGRVAIGLLSGAPLVGGDAVWVSPSVGGRRTLLRVDQRNLRVSRVAVGSDEFLDAASGDGVLWWNAPSSGTVRKVSPKGTTLSTLRLTQAGKPTFPLGSVGSPSIAVGAGAVWATVSRGAR